MGYKYGLTPNPLESGASTTSPLTSAQRRSRKVPALGQRPTAVRLTPRCIRRGDGGWGCLLADQ